MGSVGETLSAACFTLTRPSSNHTQASTWPWGMSHATLLHPLSRIVGLLRYPLEGNPFASMSVIAHPGPIASLAVTADARFLLTAGGHDGVLAVWGIELTALDTACAAGGEGIEPFLSLIDGGPDGDFFKEMELSFFYAQLHAQGDNTRETRRVGKTVPLEEVPNILRSLGVFPSEREVEEVINEIKYRDYVQTGEYVQEVTFEDIVKLYVNHRESPETTLEDIRSAFEILGAEAVTGLIDQQTLLLNLQCKGEPLSEETLRDCVMALSGEADLAAIVSDKFTAGEFAKQVLGLEEVGQYPHSPPSDTPDA